MASVLNKVKQIGLLLYRIMYIILVLVSVVTVHVRGPFEKFLDSPYYSEPELCGGEAIMSF